MLKTVFLLGGSESRADRYQLADAQMVLESLGFGVINPQSAIPDTLSGENKAYVEMAMIDSSDMVCLLPGCRKGKSVKRLLQYAVDMGDEVKYYNDVLQEETTCVISNP